jgi:hypothetical protein
MVLVAALLLAIAQAFALDGEPHAPPVYGDSRRRTVLPVCHGSRPPAFMLDDGWTWRRAGSVMDAVPGGGPGFAMKVHSGWNWMLSNSKLFTKVIAVSCWNDWLLRLDSNQQPSG